MSTHYNEWDDQAAAWIDALIDQRVLTDGPVDTRDIEDVLPSDLKGFERVHLFAGVGTWDYALTLAGWPAGRDVWTVSCPCQPFSAAGQRKGTADKRHLWPAVDWLVGQRRPHTILGEQVASKDGRAWFDHVQADLEARGYALGAAVTPAAGYGAPHERHRNYFVAVDALAECSGSRLEGGDFGALGDERSTVERGGGVGRLAGAASIGQYGRRGAGWSDGSETVYDSRSVGMADSHGRYTGDRDQPGSGKHGQQSQDGGDGELRGMAFDDGAGRQSGRRDDSSVGYWHSASAAGYADQHRTAGPTNGFWRDADWLGCRDDRWRPVEPGTFPLVNGAAARVGRLRGYGNGIVLPQAVAFIQSFLEGEAEWLSLRGL